MNIETKTLLAALRLVSLFKRHGVEVGYMPRTTNDLLANLAIGEFAFYKLLKDARVAGLIERRDNEKQRSAFRRLPLFDWCEAVVENYGIAPNELQFSILCTCSKEPETLFVVSKIAAILGVSKPCAFDACKRLAKAGLLHMELSESRYMFFFSISEKGASFVREIELAAALGKNLEMSEQVV